MKNKRLVNKLGISYVYGPEDWEATLEHINPKVFSCAEIPGEFLDVKNISDEFKSAGLDIINVKEPLPLPVARSIYGQDRKIVDKIKKQLGLLLKIISGFPCSNVSIDFGIDLAVTNQEKKNSLIGFIKEMTPALHKEGICLCIPSRIPMPPPATSEDYFTFLKETMYGGIRFSADIYPHEIQKSANLADLLRWYRFDMNIVRFIYEPEAGNLLVEKIIANWFEVFEKISYRGPVIFCPKISTSAHFIRECSRLAELVRTFNSGRATEK
ncbi:MAG TPA: hypothetical protein DET40_09445 [Lentisphaeria bacterium]|nr:MAG: hypothetical protein A2X45_08235 [Lentisphaerae bacterium GWF2_50_93]HCE43760.1 hypothetical protein [Lentisphaeria bacterium]